jgi:hypothetical protein
MLAEMLGFYLKWMPSGIAANLFGRSDSVAACCQNAAVNAAENTTKKRTDRRGQR